MIVAADSNVLFDILLPDPTFGPASRAALAGAHAGGSVIVGEVVAAEVGGQFDAEDDLERFLANSAITLVPASVAACREAGARWRAYARRRGARRRERIIPDFLVGAHALLHAGALLTRDLGFYRTYFPELRLLP